MTHFMAYLILISAGIGACAVVVELASRTRVAVGRWVWMGALVAIVLVTLYVVVVPSPVRETVGAGDATSVDGMTPLPIREVPAPPAQKQPILAAADTVLPMAWSLASLLLLLAIGYGQRRLASERRRSSSLKLNGHDVLLTENLGPAVAGIADPVVFVPRWVLALDDASQELLLAHEFEHVKQHDTRFLHAGAVIAAVLPWNPVVWWIVRRLRLAVERDCDARVLVAHPNVRRYADLLLTAASRHGISARLLAAHFGEHHSDLEARIQTMTDRKLRWRPTLSAALVAAALIAVSCEAPRPEPLAPGASGKTSAVAPQVGVEPYFEFQVEKPVTMASGSDTPRYPAILREAGVEGEVLVSFVVDGTGQADISTFKVIRSTHDLFSTAVRQAIPQMRFTAAEIGGRKVKQLVQQPFSFTIAGRKSTAARESEREVTTAGFLTGEGKKLAYTLRRGDPTVSPPPNVVVVSIDGKELARSDGRDDLLQRIAPQSIHSIEVLKTNCPAAMPCPQIKIRLAKGKTLQR